MRIAHISDIHTTTSSSFQTRLRTLLQSIRHHRVDHLIITGDLTDKATEDEYDTVIRLLNEYGFSSGNELTVIPGNHDMYPSVYQSFTFRLSTLREEFKHEPVRITKELFRVTRAYRNFTPGQYKNALRYFVQRFSYTYDTAVSAGSEDTVGFPYIKHLNDKYAVICIESNYVSPYIKMPLPLALLRYFITKEMYSVTDNPICSNGWVDIDLLKYSIDILGLQEKKLIVLLHHYMYSPEQEHRYMKSSFAKTMSLLNRDELIDTLGGYNTKLVLHGHWHVTETYTACNSMIKVLNGAGVFQPNDGKWNLLTLTPDEILHETVTLA